MNTLKTILVSVAAFVSLASTAWSAPNKFLYYNAFERATISPDGAHVAMLERSFDGKTEAVVLDTAAFKPDRFHVSDGKGGLGEITDMVWIDSEWMALTSKGEKSDVWLHVFKVGTAFPERIAKDGRRSILGVVAGTSRFLVVETPAGDAAGLCRVLEYDAANASAEPVVRYERQGKNIQCVANYKGEIVLVKRSDENGQNEAWYRYDSKSGGETKLENLKPWHRVYGVEGATDKAVIAGAITSGTPSIYLYDIAKDSVGQLLTDHSQYSIDRYGKMIFERKSGKPVGLELATTAYATFWTDNGLQGVQTNLDRELGGSVNRILEWSDDRNMVLFERIFPMLPKQIYVSDLKASRNTAIAQCGGRVQPNEVGPTKLIEIPNREGTPISAILTLPAKREGGPLPLVVWVRNGVWAGVDRVEWHPVANYFGSEGYAVLRVNYRGGEGAIGALAADTNSKEGILKTFADIDDAVAALVDAKVVDAGRIAIGGEADGAWAAAYAAMRSPDKYKAVLCFNGVYDLVAAHDAKSGGNAAAGSNLNFARSYSSMSVADIESLSITQNVSKFPKDVFVCYGKWSPAEYKSQVTDFLKQLKKAGVSAKTVQDNWYGSGLSGPLRDDAFSRAAAVLKAAFK